MSLQSQDIDNQDDGFGEKVAAYLAGQPDFFTQHPTVLHALNIPHDTGGAVSLVERQVKALRSENQKYRAQLEGLLQIARDNDSITARLHHLTLALIQAHSIDEILHTLQDQMRGLLSADTIEMKLFDSQTLSEHSQEFAPAMFQEFLENDRPNCGGLTQEQVDYLFAGQAAETKSVALIPVRSVQSVGILAIGSRDAQRFSANKNVDFLHRLGEIVSAKLNAVSQTPA